MQTSPWQGGKWDKAAQRQLFERYGERLYRIAYRYLEERMAAEDATAEAWVNIFAALPNAAFDHQNQFETWMRRIVINTSLERIRQQKRWRQEAELDIIVWEGDDFDVLEALSVQEVLQQIKKMPEGYRTILQLHVFEGFTHPEIASALGISIGTSKSQLKKARQYLQTKMSKLNAI